MKTIFQCPAHRHCYPSIKTPTDKGKAQLLAGLLSDFYTEPALDAFPRFKNNFFLMADSLNVAALIRLKFPLIRAILFGIYSQFA